MAFLRVCANVDADVIYAVDRERALTLAHTHNYNGKLAAVVVVVA